MPTASEKLERLESLLERIRARSRTGAESAGALEAASSIDHPLRGTDPGIAAAHRASAPRLELPMPAPIPVSDAAPTNPLPARHAEPRAELAPFPETPRPLATRPVSSAPPRGPLATPLPPAMPGKPIPLTKSLLMGRPRPDSTPPPPFAIETSRSEPPPATGEPSVGELANDSTAAVLAPVEEAPVEERRVVRVSSGPPPLAPLAAHAPESSAGARAPLAQAPVVALPPSMRADTAPASAARAMAIEAKRGRGGWWVASFVFLLFVAALIALRHFGLLPAAPP